MSASEKLKALGTEAEYLGSTNALTDALPQIVAVVEAAEKAGPGTTEPFASLRAALTALEEALS